MKDVISSLSVIDIGLKGIFILFFLSCKYKTNKYPLMFKTPIIKIKTINRPIEFSYEIGIEIQPIRYPDCLLYNIEGGNGLCDI